MPRGITYKQETISLSRKRGQATLQLEIERQARKTTMPAVFYSSPSFDILTRFGVGGSCGYELTNGIRSVHWLAPIIRMLHFTPCV